MRKLRLLPSAVFLFLVSCQEGTPAASSSSSEPPPAAAADWPAFVGDGFEVRMPGAPAVGPTQTAELGKSAMTMRGIAWISPSKDAQYGITTFDFPTVPLDIAPLSQLYVVVRDRVLAQVGGVVTSDIQSHIYAHEGDVIEMRELGLDGGPPAQISGRFFAHGALTDEAVRRFFDSFHLTA
jgi:hypothetical protein